MLFIYSYLQADVDYSHLNEGGYWSSSQGSSPWVRAGGPAKGVRDVESSHRQSRLNAIFVYSGREHVLLPLNDQSGSSTPSPSLALAVGLWAGSPTSGQAPSARLLLKLPQALSPNGPLLGMPSGVSGEMAQGLIAFAVLPEDKSNSQHPHVAPFNFNSNAGF